MTDEELERALDQAAEWLRLAERVCVLTGAGVSAESGVPTFRASDGLWEGHRIEDVASPDGFRRDPALVWNFYNTLSNYGDAWSGWGLGEAVKRHEPRAFARHIAAELKETIRLQDDPAYYGTGGFERLAREVPQPHDAWLTAFLDDLQTTIGDPDARPQTAAE